jgi:hypothetical protein
MKAAGENQEKTFGIIPCNTVLEILDFFCLSHIFRSTENLSILAKKVNLNRIER